MKNEEYIKVAKDLRDFADFIVESFQGKGLKKEKATFGFVRALKKLRKGEKVRLNSWEVGTYLAINKETSRLEVRTSSSQNCWIPKQVQILSKNWEVYFDEESE